MFNEASFRGASPLIPRTKRYDIESKNRARERHTNACNAILRRQFEAEIISPMTEEFGNPEFVKDSQIGFRYESCLNAMASKLMTFVGKVI